SPGDQFDVTVGAGGAGGTGLSPDGEDGQDSTVAIHGGATRVVAEGGNGGDLIATHVDHRGEGGSSSFTHTSPNMATQMFAAAGNSGQDDLVSDGGPGVAEGSGPQGSYGWGAGPDGESGTSGYVKITYLQ